MKLFENAKVGSIITLSDIQTQKEFNALTADFRIREIRKWKHELITYHGYLCDYDSKDREEDQTIMVMVREMTDMSDMLVYYLDQDGSTQDLEALIEQVGETTEEVIEGDVNVDVDIIEHFDGSETVITTEEYEDDVVVESTEYDLSQKFDVELHFDDASLPVTWEKKSFGTLYDMEYTSTVRKGVEIKAVAEYYTGDDTRGNSHCFVELSGTVDEGWIEVWYGCEITKSDIDVF